MSEAGKSNNADPLIQQWKRHLKAMTSAQRARYGELLAGRTGMTGGAPMHLTDSIRAETVQIVYRETELRGDCCAACRARARREPHVKAPTVRLTAWEGRKLSTDELRERMRALKAENPLAGENGGFDSDENRPESHAMPSENDFHPGGHQIGLPPDLTIDPDLFENPNEIAGEIEVLAYGE